MTNGQITKQILKAANALAGDQLHSRVMRLLGQFPLSSLKLVYDEDEAGVSDDAWEIIIAACVASDTQKWAAQKRWMESMGGKDQHKTFGRAV